MSVEGLFQNAKEYIQILNACKTNEVAQWRSTDLKRAVDWGVYFENVYTKISGLDPKVSSKFNSKLITLGNLELNDAIIIKGTQKTFDLEFLQQNIEYLIESLLENPYFSLELRKDLYSQDVVLEKDKIKKHCEQTINNARILEKLMEIQSSFVTDHYSSCLLPVSGETVVNSTALLEELKTVNIGSIVPATTHTTDVAKILPTARYAVERSYDEVIQNVITSPNGMETVLTTLCISTETTIQLKLLKWFTVNLNKYFQPVTSLPYTLLAITSVQYSDLFDTYIKELTAYTDHCNIRSMMESNITDCYNQLQPLWSALCQTPLRAKTIAIISQQVSRFQCLKAHDQRSKCFWINLSQNLKELKS